MKKALFTLCLSMALLFIGLQLKAQQEPQVSHNMFNNLFVNPAYAGVNGSLCLGALHRQQWIGWEENPPVTSIFSFDAPIRTFGVGLNIMHDQLGFEKNLGLKLSLGKRFSMASGTLSLGLQAGFLNKGIDFANFKATDMDDQLLTTKSVEKDMLFDIGFGAYYSIPSKLYVGLSSTQLLQAEGTYGTAKPTLARHYFFTAGYYHSLNADIELQPSLMVKSDMASTMVDVNCLALYRQKVWGGLSYRTQDAVVVLVGYNFTKNLKAGISYDLTTSQMGRNSRSSGSVEVYLGYCFKVERPHEPSSYRNPRFL